MRTLAFLLTVVIAGCSSVSQRQEVLGTYKLNAGSVTGTLRLNADDTFEQAVRSENGEARKVTGRWEWSPKDGRVILFNGIVVDHDHLGLQSNVDAIPAIKHFGKLQLECNPDVTCAYEKQ
jgi:hypothetical protein